MGSHSVTCHPTEVNLPTLLPGIHQYSFYRPTEGGRLSRSSVLHNPGVMAISELSTPIRFPKMYSFDTVHKNPAKLHSEPNYIFKVQQITRLLQANIFWRKQGQKYRSEYSIFLQTSARQEGVPSPSSPEPPAVHPTKPSRSTHASTQNSSQIYLYATTHHLYTTRRLSI